MHRKDPSHWAIAKLKLFHDVSRQYCKWRRNNSQITHLKPGSLCRIRIQLVWTDPKSFAFDKQLNAQKYVCHTMLIHVPAGF